MNANMQQQCGHGYNINEYTWFAMLEVLHALNQLFVFLPLNSHCLNPFQVKFGCLSGTGFFLWFFLWVSKIAMSGALNRLQLVSGLISAFVPVLANLKSNRIEKYAIPNCCPGYNTFSITRKTTTQSVYAVDCLNDFFRFFFIYIYI